jgi:UDP-glucuronate decarboxylase
MKKILVTGGAGFLGAHLCERLLNQGHRVVCLDNMYTGSVENIRHLFGHRFGYWVRSVTEPLPSMEFDEIYNLACPASPVHYQADPIQTYMTSVLGIWNMLTVARDNGIKVLQASTSEVYGDPTVHPQPETYNGSVNPIGIRACYDEGKRGAETLMYDFNRVHNVNIRVARIFNTYGPGMHPADGRVVSNFIMQALRGENITIYGDGSQTRSFCYRNDLVEGLIRLMASDYTLPVNLGNPGEFTIRELADLILSKTGSKSKIVFRPLPKDDPTQRRPDITRAVEYLDWVPSIGLSQGLNLTIEYFRSLIDANKA